MTPTDRVVEKMARGIASNNDDDPELYWEQYAEDARTALSSVRGLAELLALLITYADAEKPNDADPFWKQRRNKARDRFTAQGLRLARSLSEEGRV